jgi:pimeloyl-ACP methyl ester carboxylesterase
VALVGSSLGAFVAVHAAALDRTGKVDRLVLLAPALDFGGNRLRQLGEHGIDEWRRSGRLRVYHYADNTYRDVGFELYEDAAAYDAFGVTLRQPVLAFQGERDASVDPRMVERWAADRSNVDLRFWTTTTS